MTGTGAASASTDDQGGSSIEDSVSLAANGNSNAEGGTYAFATSYDAQPSSAPASTGVISETQSRTYARLDLDEASPLALGGARARNEANTGTFSATTGNPETRNVSSALAFVVDPLGTSRSPISAEADARSSAVMVDDGQLVRNQTTAASASATLARGDRGLCHQYVISVAPPGVAPIYRDISRCSGDTVSPYQT